MILWRKLQKTKRSCTDLFNQPGSTTQRGPDGLSYVAGSRSAANRDFDSTHLNFEFPFWMESSQTDFGKVVRRKWANLPFHVETASTAAS
jgi:hypothetical protein